MNNCLYLKDDEFVIINNPTSGERIEGKAIDELLHYRKQKADGRLVELPCKVGDTVFCTNTRKIVRSEITEFRIGYGNTLSFKLDNTGDVQWSVDRFGKTVFLTREEAEKALECEPSH